MTVLPAQDSGEFRAVLRRMERDGKQKATVIESKVSAPDVLVRQHQVSTNLPDEQSSSVSMQQKKMIAGIAQLKVLIEQHQHFKMN